MFMECHSIKRLQITNDIVMCTNWSYVIVGYADATKIKRLTIMINPLVAGATFKNGRGKI